jgi:hypothetical protein
MNQLVTHGADGVPALREENRVAARALRKVAVAIQYEADEVWAASPNPSFDAGVLFASTYILAAANKLEGR